MARNFIITTTDETLADSEAQEVVSNGYAGTSIVLSQITGSDCRQLDNASPSEFDSDDEQVLPMGTAVVLYAGKDAISTTPCHAAVSFTAQEYSGYWPDDNFIFILYSD
mmetsp:Transcript_17983/g.17173  ORF Transcript_17983/g.17173 Transcript_17983/m.17173 type:complete len:109 (+) Transcript_17983:254-580(+)